MRLRLLSFHFLIQSIHSFAEFCAGSILSFKQFSDDGLETCLLVLILVKGAVRYPPSSGQIHLSSGR